MTKELKINHLIPFMDSKKKSVWVDIGNGEWFEGYVVGLDLVEKRVRVAFKSYSEKDRMFYSKWFDLYFQLNPNFKKHYKIKVNK